MVKVPAHFDFELFSALRRYLRQRVIDEEQCQMALAVIARLPAERVVLSGLLAAAYALRDRFSASDVFYAILAKAEGATLLTSDAHFARAAEDYVSVRLVR